MPQPNSAPLSLSDILCQICMEILLEPVTLPCNHTLCNPCFQMTVEKSSLCCPFCRRRVSTWARYHARNKTLVNSELWERIQKEYPKECQHRANGQDSEDLQETYTMYPFPQLSKPGELREEYEAEMNKLKAEQQAQEEEERRASEEYILQLLAEEAEEHKKVEEQQRDLKEQLRHDEELARRLSTDLNVVNQMSKFSTPARVPLLSRKAVTSTSKSCKSAKNYQSRPGGIKRYLSPVVRSCSSPFQLSENEKGGRESSAPVETSFTQHTNFIWPEEEDEMPALSPQTSSHIVATSLENSFYDRPMPKLSACSEKAFFLVEQDEWVPSNNGKPEIDDKLCFAGEQGLDSRKTSQCISFLCSPRKIGNEFSQANCQQQVHYTETHILPCRVPGSSDDRQEKDSIGHNLEDMILHGTGEPNSINIFDGLAASEASKRKCEGQYLKEGSSSCSVTKRRRGCMGALEGKEERTGTVLETSLQEQQLTTLECDLYERKRQEEQDRLIALKLQKKMDREMSQISRQKGAPDEYSLRVKPSSSRVAQPEKRFTQKTASQKFKKTPKSKIKEANWNARVQSSDENRQTPKSNCQKSSPGVKRGKKTRNCISNCFYFAGEPKALQASNKQQTILDMFQKRSAIQ